MVISGSFLVQFLILIVLIGIPWCLMETALGQYSGRGPTALGEIVPIGKGKLHNITHQIKGFYTPICSLYLTYAQQKMYIIINLKILFPI